MIYIVITTSNICVKSITMCISHLLSQAIYNASIINLTQLALPSSTFYQLAIVFVTVILCIQGPFTELDWTKTTRLRYFPSLDEFLCSFLYFLLNKYLAVMNACNNNNSCLLQSFQQCINLKSCYIHLINWSYIATCKLCLQMVPSVNRFLTNFMVKPQRVESLKRPLLSMVEQCLPM